MNEILWGADIFFGKSALFWGVVTPVASIFVVLGTMLFGERFRQKWLAKQRAAGTLRTGERIFDANGQQVWVERQAPLWAKLLLLGLIPIFSIPMLISILFFLERHSGPWWEALFAPEVWPLLLVVGFVALVMFALMGLMSIRVRVDARYLDVRLGAWPWRILHVPMENILTAEIVPIHARNFGGYGIRYGSVPGHGSVCGCFMSGGCGVLIGVKEKSWTKKYLIGSDAPDTLLAMIEEFRPHD